MNRASTPTPAPKSAPRIKAAAPTTVPEIRLLLDDAESILECADIDYLVAPLFCAVERLAIAGNGYCQILNKESDATVRYDEFEEPRNEALRCLRLIVESLDYIRRELGARVHEVRCHAAEATR